MQLKELINFTLQQLVIAGDYACLVQPNVRAENGKGGNLFHDALTDADLSIQNFFEVALLARFPQFSFYGEEEARSLNAKYFPADAEYEVTLDPVNGTRLFIDQFDTFDIVATVWREGAICAALTYLPAKGAAYFALEGEGAFTLAKSEIVNQLPWRPFSIPRQSKQVLVSGAAVLYQQLEGKVPVFEFLRARLPLLPGKRAPFLPTSMAARSVLTAKKKTGELQNNCWPQTRFCISKCWPLYPELG